jgi:hypothetical protein
LLRQTRCRQIALKVAAPSFKFVILLLQLPPHGTETKLGLDSCTQHRRINWFCHKIICASLQTRDFAFLASVPSQHDCRHLGDCVVLIRAKLFQHLGAICSWHIEVEQQKRRRLRVNDLQRFGTVPAYLAVVSRGR